MFVIKKLNTKYSYINTKMQLLKFTYSSVHELSYHNGELEFSCRYQNSERKQTVLPLSKVFTFSFL